MQFLHERRRASESQERRRKLFYDGSGLPSAATPSSPLKHKASGLCAEYGNAIVQEQRIAYAQISRVQELPGNGPSLAWQYYDKGPQSCVYSSNQSMQNDSRAESAADMHSRRTSSLLENYAQRH